LSSTRRGNLLIGQSGGATAVINASLVGAVEAALAERHIDGIYGMLNGIEGLLKKDVIDLRQQSPGLWSQLLNTPSAALGSCRYKLNAGDDERILEILRQFNIRFVLYIGGNDSADTAHQLAQAAAKSGDDISFISIPKTIDNDLPYTDHCPGYGSAARFLAQATIDTTMNTISIPWHYPVKVIETMGRDAGWLAASTALGKRDEIDPPHIILMPEQPFVAERFLQRVEEIYRRQRYVIIVATETIRDEQGRALGSATQSGSDAFQHPLLSGAAQALVTLVTQQLKLRARFEKPGDLQRMASTSFSATDRSEAYLVGKMGVTALLDGQNDKMITLVRHDEPAYHCTTGLVDLALIANEQRLLPDEYLDESKTMVTQAFIKHAQPFIGEPLSQHARLVTTRLNSR
jgi:ATP-dependent phosphofructokinase / diphosphate-dependent phosphofructokinase